MTASPYRRHREDMDISRDTRPPAARTVGVAEAVALAGFVAYLAVPAAVRVAAAVVMTAGALAAAGLAVGWMLRRHGSRALGSVTVVASLGLLGSVAYLSSLADEPTAIPLAGTFALLLSLVGLVVTGVLLLRRR
jgi:hypothetical protein